MKILIVDRLCIGQKNSDWKEGYEFYYAFKNLGYDCDIAGLNCFISEENIPIISKKYDLIIITENYPVGWKWWDWSSIKTPKLFWAIGSPATQAQDSKWCWPPKWQALHAACLGCARALA